MSRSFFIFFLFFLFVQIKRFSQRRCNYTWGRRRSLEGYVRKWFFFLLTPKIISVFYYYYHYNFPAKLPPPPTYIICNVVICNVVFETTTTTPPPPEELVFILYNNIYRERHAHAPNNRVISPPPTNQINAIWMHTTMVLILLYILYLDIQYTTYYSVSLSPVFQWTAVCNYGVLYVYIFPYTTIMLSHVYILYIHIYIYMCVYKLCEFSTCKTVCFYYFDTLKL